MLAPEKMLRVLLFALTITLSLGVQAQQAQRAAEIGIDETAFSFISLLFLPETELSEPRNHIEQNWQPSFAAMALDVLSLNRRPEVRNWLFDVMREKTGVVLENDLDAWFIWLWNQPEQRYAHYGQFKSYSYRMIDPKFGGYFADDRETDIRLDEVRWGGVRQDGIPPLREPKMISADEADYLDDDDVVFGVKINGDARAYPNRILAWHEMFVDEIGGVNYAGVYCTLCGAVILYETTQGDINFAMGTSGFLFRSNKLMYDQATQSLWSTTRGEPVIGPLTNQGIRLQRSFVVTTTWGEWRRRHPDTAVLSLDTGHQRNYGEGVAYRDYFATDELLFNVPELDDRLKNKDEVLALTFPALTDDTMAIHAGFLQKNPVYEDTLGAMSFVVLTDDSGANRVYESGELSFADYDGDRRVTDAGGDTWTLAEDGLRSDDGRILKRLAAHRAFWFGWYAVHNDTRLVK